MSIFGRKKGENGNGMRGRKYGIRGFGEAVLSSRERWLNNPLLRPNGHCLVREPVTHSLTASGLVLTREVVKYSLTASGPFLTREVVKYSLTASGPLPLI
jgi:hypothetical protein